MTLKHIKDADVYHKRVLVRASLNVSFDLKGEISDDFRLRQIIPTIKFLMGKRAKVILMGHLGRPKGKIDSNLTMVKVANRLSELLDHEVSHLDDCIGTPVQMVVSLLSAGSVVLLENLRFHIHEEQGDLGFARELAKLGDIYVNEAFSDSDSEHASITRITELMPSYMGFAFETEINKLSTLMQPESPFVLILGGAKVSDKMPIINKFISNADTILIGGACANTFFASDGIVVGDSLLERNLIDFAKTIDRSKIILPIDLVLDNKTIIDATQNISPGLKALDIGPKTISLFASKIRDAKTVFWNGPMGLAENPEFSLGTIGIAKILGSNIGTIVVGGGDTTVILAKYNIRIPNAYISSGGRAMLRYLSGDRLAGLLALESNEIQ